MPNSSNYFAHRTVAERYSHGRPDVHSAITRRIREFTGATRFSWALDVACGTGQSTRAVAEIADRVVGIDISAEMLAQATTSHNIQYQQSSAESLPFADSSFDLVTVGLAFHWFDQKRFLGEGRRVLRNNGWLVIYNSGFLGELAEEPAFGPWYRDVYLSRYATPPRSQPTVSEEFVRPYGFKFHGRDTLTQGIAMSRDQCVSYLLTQSNVIAAVERGSEGLETVAAFLSDSVVPFFRDEARTMQFRADIVFLRACS
jgi:SAM-dependent methyltransferase